MNPTRLVDDPDTDLSEVTLLRAGQSEAMSDETRRKILAGIGVGGALAGAASLHAASVSAVGKATWPAWLKTGFLLGALGGLAGGLAYLGLGSEQTEQQHAPQPVPAAASEPTRQAAPPAADEHADVPLYQAEDLPLDVEQSGNAQGAPRVAAPGKPAPNKAELGAELAALRTAKSALAQGNPTVALQQVRDYRAQFPRGKLGVEATVIEIEALVALGRRAQAQKLAEPLLTGDSPYAPRVRSLLGL
jgi:hypothetical protein